MILALAVGHELLKNKIKIHLGMNIIVVQRVVQHHSYNKDCICDTTIRKKNPSKTTSEGNFYDYMIQFFKSDKKWP